MNPETLHKIYFLGIGGIGMSALARYFMHLGISVSGYDKSPSPLTRQLIDEGIEVHYEEDLSKIPEDVELVIYTPAIPMENLEFEYLREKGLPLLKRSQILGMLTTNKKTIAVSGTHGKTTTSTMIAWIFSQSPLNCTAFLGGISKNFESNLIIGQQGDYVVTEADEYDRSFLNLKPSMAIITSVDADHLDIYGDKATLEQAFAGFAARIIPGGNLVIKKGIGLNLPNAKQLNTFTYSAEERADFYATNIRPDNQSYVFDLITPDGLIPDLHLNIPGRINIENAVAAISIAFLAGIDQETIRNAIAAFSGVYRRLDIRFQSTGIIYMDDYAHHPEEIKACIHSVREMFPGKKLTGIFQPHLYTRTRDMADEFARALSALDVLILLDIYPARELPIPGVNSAELLEKIEMTHKYLWNKDEVVSRIATLRPEILLTLGAGDIDQLVTPITRELSRLNDNITDNY